MWPTGRLHGELFSWGLPTVIDSGRISTVTACPDGQSCVGTLSFAPSGPTVTVLASATLPSSRFIVPTNSATKRFCRLR